ncbi:hypothetical protein QZH41_004591 [Actinostola sp. cb2023]|nr:hypothetical protein QZH41_004591 [Actinostola sp. cb2023]
MQKSLKGLDNVTAEGTEAFDSISRMVETLVENGADRIMGQNSHQAIKEAKRYLKTDFKAHIGREENCSNHCPVHALSDPTNLHFKQECEHDHIAECERYEALDNLLEDVLKMLDDVELTEVQKERMKFEYNDCIRSIRAWKSHLLRSVNQEEAKQDILNNLDDEGCLIIIDWAMKFLPQHYRERMSDFFGKRGRSWHVSAVITKKEEKYEVECFVHMFNTCNQNSFAVASILEHLFYTIKQEYPTIRKAFLRSDNAGCYHNSFLLLALSDIGEKTGIKPLRYDFSDPKPGKDICDRKTAPMKAHMKRWVSEKHDILTAEEVSNSIKIPVINLLNNFSFETGIRAWKTYNVGPGRMLMYSEFKIQTQDDICLKVVEPFWRTNKRAWNSWRKQ